jgi:hypothetical protein
MPKKIKLKQEDIESIVKSIISEQISEVDDVYKEEPQKDDEESSDEMGDVPSNIIFDDEISDWDNEMQKAELPMESPEDDKSSAVFVKNPETNDVYLIDSNTSKIYEKF